MNNKLEGEYGNFTYMTQRYFLNIYDVENIKIKLSHWWFKEKQRYK